MSALTAYHLVALLLLALGIYGFVRRKSLVGMLISMELMLNGAGLSIAASGQLTRADASLAQLSSLLVMGLAAAEATLALAIILVVAKRFGSASAQDITELKG
ncbi:NADH-quinone oxidoreductase subunit NuoK [Salidesulfovibrio brasiliensis]|uniref:NADH-quinone oxidoreductase subunit NuoK n=1 Tax=Salidesulfovibrio brasiliensis TaxID=221711 RepID=UPI0006D07B05|nr:NADH-quinone oxidoreductase subunit NuoK [Salidesulfovibrio brasiliensis]